MFNEIQMAPPDPILGLTEAFKDDTNPDKVNLSVGVYKDGAGQTPILSSVKKAERVLLERETSKSYLPMPGSPEYGKAVRILVFGEDSDLVSSGRAVTAQAPGGTGALRVVGDFLHAIRPEAKLWISEPTWANHLGIFGAAGMAIERYPYYDADTHGLDFEAMMAALETIPSGDAVLLHGCCHNPTGVDPSPEQWGRMGETLKARGILPVVDFAYQGLAEGIDADAVGARTLATAGCEVLICSSFSKNFSLYCERVGAVTLVAETPAAAQAAFSHLKLAIRRNYSNPPAHGSAIVAMVVGDPELRAEWEGEVAAIRDRIQEMRQLFVDTLKAKGVKQDFSFIVRQNGMFSFSGLTKEQVERLRTENSIYIVSSGRINVAGMTRHNMDMICEAIAKVL